MRSNKAAYCVALGVAAAIALSARLRAGAMGQGAGAGYLPDADGSKVVSATRADAAEQGGITVLTQAIANKEGGPDGALAKFGEIYAFNPYFFAMKKGEPTLVHFWNLQAEDEHDVAIMDDKGNVYMDVKLPPLSDTALRLTFHKKGLFTFKCLTHQPEMSGQILVLP